MIKTVLIGKIHDKAEKLLQEKTQLQQVSAEDFAKVKQFPEVEAVVLRTFTKLGKEELAKFPKLKYVVSCSVGLDNLDLEGLRAKKIELINCLGTNANSVAEYTVYLILSLLRNSRPVAELKNKTVGIIGLGYIGKLVAKKLTGLECKIIACDVIKQEPKLLDQLKVEMKSFSEVVRKADILTVHVPLNENTERLINKKAFEQIKERAYFINTSRAEVIDEKALIAVQHKLKGIALDVYSEKLKPRLKISNLILTEHIAAQGEDSFEKMCEEPIKKFVQKVK